MSQTINDFTVKTLIDSELIEQQMQCKEWLYDFNHSRPREQDLRKELLGKMPTQEDIDALIEKYQLEGWD
ncbi:maltose acetyltransferase domain-containing protein [Vibrio sp.]|uniref:maltose acetyltransferase domain-containing protein n=1 Tax=Vibrio sp. TaxID=678 RepID=UPI003AA8FEF3